MKQLANHQVSRYCSGSFARAIPTKLLLALFAACPLLASGNTIDALVTGTFDWQRVSLLATGVIALIRARAATV